jgi:nucleoid-associated protein YgaU
VPGLGLLEVRMGKAVVLEALAWGVDEPAASPAAAPEKPAEPAAPQPAAAPKAPESEAAPAAASTDGIEASVPNPLHDAKVGEWIRLRSVVQGEETIATLRVVEVTDDEVHLDSRVAYGGQEIRGAVLRRPRSETVPAGGRGGQVEIGRETVQVKGTSLDCVTVTRTTRRGQVDKRWICTGIPVTGLVRQERDGQVVKELLDWGTGEPPALPAEGR